MLFNLQGTVPMKLFHVRLILRHLLFNIFFSLPSDILFYYVVIWFDDFISIILFALCFIHQLFFNGFSDISRALTAVFPWGFLIFNFVFVFFLAVQLAPASSKKCDRLA